MQCIACGRPLLRAAATVPEKKGSDAHPAGAVGPVCAERLGLLVRRVPLFARKRRAKQAAPLKRDGRQQDWVGAA